MCCEQDIGVAGPDYATEVLIGPAHAALPDSTVSPEETLAAVEGVGHQCVGHHNLEVSTSTWSAGQHRNQPINLPKMDVADRPRQEKEEDDTTRCRRTFRQQTTRHLMKGKPDKTPEE